MYGYQGYGYPQNYPNQNYMPRGYSQPQPQPQMPISQQAPPMEMPIQDIKFVNKAQAEAYIVYPNTRVVLIDKESGIAYIKTADGMGQSQTDYFRFEPINADGTPIKHQEPVPQVNFDDFVKREQLKDYGFVTSDQHQKVLSELENIKKMLQANKPTTNIK